MDFFFFPQISLASLIADATGGEDISAFRSLRTLRAFRPLRAISRWQSMRVFILNLYLTWLDTGSMSFWSNNSVIWYIGNYFTTDCGECLDVGYPSYPERAGGLHGFLANLQYNGRPVLFWAVLQMQGFLGGGTIAERGGQQVAVSGYGCHPQLLLGQLQYQLWQCSQWLLGFVSSGYLWRLDGGDGWCNRLYKGN